MVLAAIWYSSEDGAMDAPLTTVYLERQHVRISRAIDNQRSLMMTLLRGTFASKLYLY